MPQIDRSVLLPYPAACVFGVVCDVEAYPEFVPGCAAVRIDADGDAGTEATVDIEARGFRESFATRNETISDGDATTLLMHLVDGPFDTFEGQWRVVEIGGGAGSRVELSVAFEFKNALARLLGLSFGRALDRLADRIVEAFCERIRNECTAP